MPTANLTNLKFQPMPSVPNLKVAEDIQTDSGDKLLAVATGTDIIHVLSADGTLKGFGGLTVVGPNITTIPLDWKALIKGAIGAAGGGGGIKSCTQTTTTVVEPGGKTTTTTTQTCKA